METIKRQKTAEDFRKRFNRSIKPLSRPNIETEERRSGSLLETIEETAPDEFKESEIVERLGYSKENLYKIIENYLGNDPKLKEVADKILAEAADPMRAVANNDNDFLERHSNSTNLLEVIVVTDGSRPSFMIKNGKVDFDSSPVGEWKDVIEAGGANLQRAIDCTGRINNGSTHVGTGFLVHRNLIVTNRHVLQAVARQKNDGSWELRPDSNIDFGHEFQGIASLNKRKLTNLIFTGTKTIDRFRLDHSKLDLALIELANVPDEQVPPHVLDWNKGTAWTWDGQDVFIVGYPGDPRALNVPDYTPALLEQLFMTTFGCKRLAPGRVMERSADDLDWTLKHDATTLGGNSGSVIVPKSLELRASALHYGGDLNKPRENWGHILALVMAEKDVQNKALEDYLQKNNVVIDSDD